MAVVVFCLVIGEFTLRRWFPLDTVVLQADKRYLYKFIPNSRQLSRPLTASGAPVVLFTINRQGRRGDLLPNGGKPRIMVYGDSFIAAEGTPLKQTFTSQLEQRLSVPVINAGVPGYGPDQESLVMEDEIDRTKPNLIIFAIYSGNDFGDLVRNKIFELNQQGRLIQNQPVLDPKLLRYFEDARKQQGRLQTIRRLRDILHPRRAAANPYLTHPQGLVEAWIAQCRQEYENDRVEHDPQVHNLFADAYDIDISTEARSASATYKTALMERVIERVAAIAAMRSVPILFLIIPSPIDALDHWDVSMDPARFSGYDRARLTGTLEKIMRSHGFHYLNLFQPFRAHQSEGLYYHGLDDHWNAAGQRLAAALTAGQIKPM